MARTTRALLLLGSILTTTSALGQVSGTVRDGTTLLPIEGASVRLQATETRTTAGADGTFQLPASGSDVVVVGAAKGYFNRSVTVTTPADGVLFELAAVPPQDDPDYQPVAPKTCAACHYEIYRQWTDSAMAHAGTNTWVHDIYSGTGTKDGSEGFVYTRDSVHASENPASECASCHQPEAWLRTPFTALVQPESLEASRGVSCEICHKIADIDDSRPNFPGLFEGVVTMTRPAGPWQVSYGMLGDVDYEVGNTMRASYQPQLAAAICAACHQDKNDPDGDGDFEQPNGVISEPTYIEWKESPYGDPESEIYQSCVDCHMRPTEAGLACSILLGAYERPPGQVRSHAIEGTTPEYLENAVTMTVGPSVDGDQLQVSVTILNDQTGHHVPTGVTIRNMILVVEAWQGSSRLAHTGSQTVHALGGEGDPAQGYLAGLPGKLYGKRNHGADGKGPVFFTDATGIEADNRLAALESDTTDYTFDMPTAGAVRLDVRLIYRRSWRTLVDAKRWEQDGHGAPLADVTPPHFGHLMEASFFECSAAAGCSPVAGGAAPDSSTSSAPAPSEDAACSAGRGGPGAAAAWLLLALLLGLRIRRRGAMVCLMCGALLLGCDDEVVAPGGVIAPAPGQTFQTLAEWNLFSDIRAQEPAPGVVPYEPISALYTDYTFKRRFLWVPPGTTIGYEDEDIWRFPVGTILVKTFSYQNDMRDPAQGERLLETRVLHRKGSGWGVHTYIYDESQSHAEREVAGETIQAEWIHADGKLRTNSYGVPNTNECKECHGDEHAMDVLGGRTRQLDRDYDYGEGAVNQIDHFAALGLFDRQPPPASERVRLADPFGEAPLNDRARAYLDTNCSVCHSPGRDAGSSGLWLDFPNTDPSVQSEATWGVCKVPASAGGATCGLTYDIVPGDAAHSVMICRMASGSPKVRMPSVGSAIAHAEGVILIREWIEAMTGSCD